MDAILFLTFAAIAVACAINLVVQTHPISSALSLVGVMGSLAVLYLLLGGEFIAAAQVIVYAGAIMVLFVFVIMLLNAGAERSADAQGARAAASALPLLFVAARRWSLSSIQTQVPQHRRREVRRVPPAAAPRRSAARCSPTTCCPSKSPRS